MKWTDAMVMIGAFVLLAFAGAIANGGDTNTMSFTTDNSCLSIIDSDDLILTISPSSNITFCLSDTNSITVAGYMEVRDNGKCVAVIGADKKLTMKGSMTKDELIYRLLESWVVSTHQQAEWADMWRRQSDYLLDKAMQKQSQ